MLMEFEEQLGLMPLECLILKMTLKGPLILNSLLPILFIALWNFFICVFLCDRDPKLEPIRRTIVMEIQDDRYKSQLEDS
jgi:hypothetical protein